MKIRGNLLLYGAGPTKIGAQLKQSTEYARDLLNLYFRKFSHVKKLLDGFVANAKTKKVAISPLDGRRIDLGGIDWHNGGQVSHAMNQAKNLPLQGCGVSITKLALCYIADKLKEFKLDAKIVNVIHDSQFCRG